MSPCRRRIALGLALFAGAAAIAAAMGLVPIAASSGHWAVTEWLLHATMRRSVQLRARWAGAPPDLADPALVLRGAGHYAAGCAPCHGAPGATASKIVQQMTPSPPELASRIGAWGPKELFWIVRHGVKFTGMPAWPAQERDDEVWSVVAFLMRLPHLSDAGYRRLVFGSADGSEAMPATDADSGLGSASGWQPTIAADEPATPLVALNEPLARLIASCTRCHGKDGRGRIPGAFPRLAGQNAAYLAGSLDAYASGGRHSGIMQPLAAALDEPTRQALARYFGGLTPMWSKAAGAGHGDPSPAGMDPPADAALIARGALIARRGIPERKVAACAPCHGLSAPKRSGTEPDTPRNPHYPLLAGQDQVYLAQQLGLFIEQRRGGTPWLQVMEISTHRLDPREAEAVAAYYAASGP